MCTTYMMIMASMLLSGLGWVVLQACFVSWVGLGPLATGLGWIGSQKIDQRPCVVYTMVMSFCLSVRLSIRLSVACEICYVIR